MWTRNEVTEVRERFADGSGDELRQESDGRFLKVFGMFTVLFVAAVAAGVALSGCGSNSGSTGHVSDNAPAVVTGDVATAQVASVTPAPPPAGSGLSAQDQAVREGLPPDLTVSVGDTLAAPGQAVEFTVVGTDDVREVALSDGRDEPLPFVRDAGTNVWRAQYRMPLRPRHDRLGVSVTARNDAQRWRRVWVFLSVNHGDSTNAVEAPVDNPDELDEVQR